MEYVVFKLVRDEFHIWFGSKYVNVKNVLLRVTGEKPKRKCKNRQRTLLNLQVDDKLISVRRKMT